MKRSRCPSPQTTSVLLALAVDPQTWRYGYDLCQETGLKAGTMYPILMRLAEQRLLETEWERASPPGRPPRHLYRLSKAGRAAAEALPKTAERIANARDLQNQRKLEGAT
jgi:PadR family transcriptional regulator PadR